MEIFPAIDLHNGQAVRLTQGDYNQVEVFFKNPVEVLNYFEKNKSKNLHIVDLDGAKDGEKKNFNVIKELVNKSNFFIQVGGGIRTEETIKEYLDLGVDRVILGTIAVKDREFLINMVNKYKEKIAVSVDAKDNKVALNGWRELSEVNSIEFCEELEKIGVETIIYTDISKDGMLQGTNLDIYKELHNKVNMNIIASGGITYKSEIDELKKLNLYGAIVGKAIYTGKIDLKEIV